MSIDLDRPYLFQVRPLHLETLDSFTARTLTANFETLQHKNYLVRLATPSLRAADQAATWADILRKKTGRSTVPLDTDPRTRLRHPDGSTCEYCATDLPQRWMCTLCSRGDQVRQHPHFDTLVCITHRRWVGLNDAPESQRPVGDEYVAAALAFGKLRRKGRLDLRLYRVLSAAVSGRLSRDSSTTENGEVAAFPVVVQIARALDDSGIQRTIFDTSSFAASFEVLDQLVTEAIGGTAAEVTRAIWLYLRPTFRAIRHAILLGQAYAPSWPHDFRLPTQVATEVIRSAGELEPFARLLEETGDTEDEAWGHDVTRVVSEGAPGRSARFLAICAHGHEFETDVRARSAKPRNCTVCNHSVLAPGYNDMQTLEPAIASELDADLNRGLTARDIAPSSHEEFFWRCPKAQHCYVATASNRTSARMGCGLCSNRTLVAGVNDLSTTHPTIAIDLDPSYAEYHPATSFLACSEVKVPWLCPAGHAYTMRVYDRTHGGRCKECEHAANRSTNKNLTATHPTIAREWHPTENGELRPEDFSHGSKETVIWLCPVGHDYPMRIERRTAGYNCSVCSRRRFVPMVNDLRTLEPVMSLEYHSYKNGPREPHEFTPGNHLYWWKCLAAGHVTHQSVPHRRRSKGCTDCAPEVRILANN